MLDGENFIYTYLKYEGMSCMINYDLTYSSCPMEEHRAATKLLQRTRFGAELFSWVHVIPDTPISASVLLLQVCLGLPTLLLPCGFQSRAWRVMFEDGFLSVWPIHPHFLLRISISTCCCPVLSQSSLFEIFSDHLMPRM